MTKNDTLVIPSELKRSSGFLMALGILFVLLGAVGLSLSVWFTYASMLFFGVILLTAGILQLIDTFKSNGWKTMLWHLLISILYIIAGLVVIYNPFFASTVITAMIAWILIFIGLIRISMAFTLRHETGHGWLLLAGIFAIVLGILILMQWPQSGFWIIGLFIAIEIMITGWAYIFTAFDIKNKRNRLMNK